MVIPKDFKRYYKDKRGDARRRGIDWQMSIEECWSLWQPYWSLRQVKLGSSGWSLARYQDQGPYSRDNCRVISHGDNSRERLETRGNPWSTNRQKIMKIEGRVYRTLREAAEVYAINATTVRDRCLSSNFPDWQYV